MTQGYEFVDIEMGKGEHKKGGKYPTPNQKVPMMVLPDGTQLGESVAICRYLEETHGDNGLLFGRSPLERALIEMWQRRVEQQIAIPMMNSFRWGSPRTSSPSAGTTACARRTPRRSSR